MLINIFFIDSYKLLDSSENTIYIDETGIAWPSDKENKFKRKSDYNITQWTDVENGNSYIYKQNSYNYTYI